MSILAGFRRLVFVLLCSAIVGIGSERMFWYWADEPLDHGIVTLVYAPAVAGVSWLIDRYRVTGWWSLLLVAPVAGLLVEGVITPVVYSGGPFVPLFPVWFGVWHGVLSVAVLLFGFRYWLVTGQMHRLLVASGVLGTFWGTWSTTMWLPENLEDPELIADQGGPLQLLDPAEFTLYTVLFSAILAAAHLLLGRGLWVSSFEPARVTRWIWCGTTAAVVIAWTFAIPWAAPMFAAYLGIQLWGLRRHARASSRPSLLERLDGRFGPRALWPISALPVTAAGTYAIWWAIDPPEAFVRGALMYGTIGLQTLVGSVLFVVALRRTGRTPASERREHGLVEVDRAPAARAS